MRLAQQGMADDLAGRRDQVRATGLADLECRQELRDVGHLVLDGPHADRACRPAGDRARQDEAGRPRGEEEGVDHTAPSAARAASYHPRVRGSYGLDVSPRAPSRIRPSPRGSPGSARRSSSCSRHVSRTPALGRPIRGEVDAVLRRRTSTRSRSGLDSQARRAGSAASGADPRDPRAPARRRTAL